MIDLIKPNWPAPSHVHAYSTTRKGGYSLSPYDSFNLAEHVGDDEETVAINRQILQETLDLPSSPIWLEQVHGTEVYCADAGSMAVVADASYTTTADRVCVVMTADCLPILMTNRQGTFVSAIHAGWRGLAGGIIEKTVNLLAKHGPDFLVWLGPAIGPEVFEVGPEVREQFISKDRDLERAFVATTSDRYLADIYELARIHLQKLDLTNDQIYGGEYSTYADKELFFSYRRDGNKTGRMASLIWLGEHF